MNVKVSDMMVREVLTAEPQHTVERLRRIMENNNVHAVPIVGHGGEIMGIVTSGDLVHAVKDYTPASHIMTEQVFTIPQYNDVHFAARLMRNHGVHHVVVTHEKQIVGMLSSFDLLRLVEEYRFVMKPAPPHPSTHVEK